MHLRFNVPPQLTCAWLIQTKMYQSLARILSLSVCLSLPASSKRLLSVCVSLCMVCGGYKNKKSRYKVEPQPELETSSAFRSLSLSHSFYLFYLSV